MTRSLLLVISMLLSGFPASGVPAPAQALPVGAQDAQAARAAAQEVPARLTLEDALRIAQQRNPAYRQALNDVDVAAAEERAGWGEFLPTFDADRKSVV